MSPRPLHRNTREYDKLRYLKKKQAQQKEPKWAEGENHPFYKPNRDQYAQMYYDENKEDLKIKRTEPIFCKFCDKNIQKKFIKRHYDTEKHQKMEKLYENSKNDKTLSKCEICDVFYKTARIHIHYQNAHDIVRDPEIISFYT